ncbi:MAG: acyltransferase, partial [Gammaproteobacteria bacterium]|nr:acyltransferase [Gammaproteobacteria bacterium]
MFGLFRLLLAVMVMVMVGHLFWISDFGRYAVFGFFILSGYLMTFLMHESYSYQLDGLKKFVANRVLRLYPAYWVACVFSIFLILCLGEVNTRVVSRSLSLPQTLDIIVVNLTMVSFSLFPHEVGPRLSPATWALTVELFYYCLIGLGVSKTKTRTAVWLCLSLTYVLLTYALGLFWHSRYFALPAGSLPFSIGALLYFLHKENWEPNWIKRPILSSKYLMLALIVNAGIGSKIQLDDSMLDIVELFFYANLLICSLLIYSIIRGDSLVNISKKLDKTLGDYSYPIYLIHWQIGTLASFIVYGNVVSLKYQIAPMAWLVSGILVMFS